MTDADQNRDATPLPERRGNSGSDRSLLHDERAIEGLPIRLVIAIVVGVAAMAIMMGLLGNIGTSPGQTELEAHISSADEVINMSDVNNGPNGASVSIEVMSEDGEPVTDGRVMVEAGTAQLDTPQTKQIGSGSGGDNVVDFNFEQGEASEVSLRSDQNQGTLTITIFPPSDSDYSDSLANAEIIVIDDT